MENPVIIFGAKGLGPVALEIFQSNGVVVYGFLDDDATLHNTEVNDITVYGSTDDEGFTKLIGKKTEAFIATDENKLRKNLVEFLLETRKVQPANAVHKLAYISPRASIGYGNLVNAGAVIAINAVIESYTIINTGVKIEHGAKIENFVQIGTGSNIGAGVTISENAFIGAGVTIVPGVTIGKSARIGAGSVVVENVAAKATVFGNPAKPLG